ncbi:Histone deacetylase 6 [Holothuria leucospilota]|uniref:Protein deacetylase HDAC6 n=1 Tax=Holothuria leucospilota TaxID=206669 RepID=A0A9Q1CN65_HOLLE|nr:Histone deacetylase 6 [Holothuria leucospilota]
MADQEEREEDTSLQQSEEKPAEDGKGSTKKSSKSTLEEVKRKAREEMARKKREEEAADRDEMAVEFVGMKLVESKVVPVVKRTGIVYDDMCLKHACKFGSIHGKADSPERLEVIKRKLSEEGLMNRCISVPVRPVTDQEMKAIHSDEYIAILKSLKDLPDDKIKSLAESYDSVFLCQESFHIASHVAGGVIDLVKKVYEGELQNGFAVIRPPGHHAMHNEANGYSLLNNIAIAAKLAVEEWGVKRVLIVDWDVHHGQGVQRAFYNDPRVLYFSMHRYERGKFWPHLPESDWDHVGDGKGQGYNVNVPWNETGMGDAEYFAVFQDVLLPLALEFQPDLVLVAAGFDSALGDPKGEMSLSPSFYSHMTHMLMGLANGKLTLILEGGYNLVSLANGVAASLEALLGDPCPPFAKLKPPSESAQETIYNIIQQLQPFWKCFQSFLKVFHKYHLEISIEDREDKTEEKSAETEESASIDKYPPTPHRTCLVYDDRMKRHRLGFGPFFYELTKKTSQPTRIWMEENLNHPERPERIARIYRKHEEYGLVDRCLRVEARHATVEELSLCHSERHIKDIADTRKLSVPELSKKMCEYNSIYLHPDSYDCALLATGSLLNVLDTVLTGKSRSGVAIIRPPGHHAGEDNAAGFCFFNSAPIATKYAQSKYKTKRILIVDWDVHHGNGTQSILEADPGVLYISLHRFDNGFFYPGRSGDPKNVGIGAGTGYNINIAWNNGPMGDAEYLAAFRHVIMPIAYEYNPELVLVSAGFDAARGDPLGDYDVTPDGYGLMTHMLSSLAGGKVIVLLEGGYNLVSISESMSRCTHSLLGDPCLNFDPGQPKPEAYADMMSTLEYHYKYWKSARFQLNFLRYQLQKWHERLDQIREAEEAAERLKKAETAEDSIETVTEAVKSISLSDPQTSTSNNESMKSDSSRNQETGGGDHMETEIKTEKKGGATPDDTQGAQGDGVLAAGGGAEELMGAAGGSNKPVGGIQIGSLLPEGVDPNEASMYAVEPLPWCPHLETNVLPVPEGGLDARALCLVCSGVKENWVCLSCYQVLCGRFMNEHMLLHGLETEHRVVLSFADLSVWCYACDSYVHNQIILPAKQAAHLSKFGEDMPNT